MEKLQQFWRTTDRRLLISDLVLSLVINPLFLKQHLVSRVQIIIWLLLLRCLGRQKSRQAAGSLLAAAGLFSRLSDRRPTFSSITLHLLFRTGLFRHRIPG